MGSAANAVIPAAFNEATNSGNSSGGGAVSGTDSESEPDTLGRMVKDLTAVQWTPSLEGRLEEILIRNAFDFKSAAKEFQRYLNCPENPDVMQTVFYKIDAKTLQLKWTDIEIRKHVIPQMQQDHDNAEDGANEDVEDDLPPLEQIEKKDKTRSDERNKAPSPEPL